MSNSFIVDCNTNTMYISDVLPSWSNRITMAAFCACTLILAIYLMMNNQKLVGNFDPPVEKDKNVPSDILQVSEKNDWKFPINYSH